MPGIYENAIANLRRYVGEAFRAGTALFPYYTLHGVEHLEELDRLALLVGSAIPGLTPERLGLLRLAIAVHDFAMVDVPAEAREKELRRRLGDAIPLADIVRKTHQDEIERCFTKPERISFLMSLIPGATPGLLEDVATIAKHHRLHPLDQAPGHVRDLCALMRILDELDIGPRRAPFVTYEALRPRMKSDAKLHWLKHLCSRAVESYPTFSIEDKNHLRIFRISVVVGATESSWEPLQNAVIGKLEACLEGELVNQVLREMLQVEFKIAPSLDLPSGPTLWLHPSLREDLDSPGVAHLLRSKNSDPAPIPAVKHEVLGTESPGHLVAASVRRSSQEFKVIAVPPERLAEFLCNSGRLTVISNTYVAPEEETVGGVAGASSRFFVGSADSGKTRAALEWLEHVIGTASSQWVVFRTDVGTLPADVNTIVLDRTLYEELPLPTKAILFLDDLPTNLPAPSDTLLPAEEAVRDFFRWFRELPFLRERRVVGTIRLEDLHTRPEWPEVLPSLGHELELVRLHPLDTQRYRKLWEGMSAGGVSRSMTRGVESFEIDLKPGFLEAVSERKADPEAVATFVQQNALKAKTALSMEDAASFSESAVDTWLRETWPAVHQAYGVTAKVFFTLARFVEGGLRPMSGFSLSMGPHWTYHEQWGPELCELQGGAAGTYLPILEKLVADGHATGERGVRIRPKFDFLLQADNLSGVEFELPNADWFVQRSSGLEGKHRFLFAVQLSSLDMERPSIHDKDLLRGWGIGSLFLSAAPENENRRSTLLERSITNLHEVLKIDYKDSLTWTVLGFSLAQKAKEESDATKSAELLDQAIAAFRSSTQANPNNSQAWISLGVSLGQKAGQESDATKSAELMDEAMTAFRRATQANPNNSQAWINLGISLKHKATRERDAEKADELHDEVIAAYRGATQADPNNSQAWTSLGINLSRKAEQETDAAKSAELLDEAISVFRRVTQIDPNNSLAWTNVGISLGEKADQESDANKVAKLRDEEISAYCRATQVDPNNSWAWTNFGVSLGRKADQESNAAKIAELQDEEMSAYRKATQADPNNSRAWNNFGISLSRKADQESDAAKVTELRDEAMSAHRTATQADPNNSQAWTNFGVSLGLKADEERNTTKAAELRDEAVAAFRIATQVDTNNSPVWSKLGISLGEKADQESDATKVAELRDEAMSAHRRATQADPNNSQAWTNFGVSLGLKADEERNTTKAAELRDEAVAAFRIATQVDTNNSPAWSNLGISLGQKAGQESDLTKVAELRDEAVSAFRRVTQADPNDSKAWTNFGISLGQKADQESDATKVAWLRDEEMSAYRSATQADPSNSQAWTNFGFSLGQKADQESDATKVAWLRDEEMSAYRSATQADPNDSQAWINFGISLGQKAHQEKDAAKSAELLDEAISAFRRVTQLDPNNSQAWTVLGINISQKAAQESDAAKASYLRDEAIAAYHIATQANPNNGEAWILLGISLGQKAEQESDPAKVSELRDEEISACRNATQVDPRNSDAWDNLSSSLLRRGRVEGSEQELREALEASREATLLGAGRYNLACALALVGETNEAFAELAGCLEREEISREHVAHDPDWEHLHLDHRFQSLLQSREVPDPMQAHYERGLRVRKRSGGSC
jgi:Flp pilus assembly protein TadD